MRICGNIVDVVKKATIKGFVNIENDKIESIQEADINESRFIIPGFIDAHIHIESSMLTPLVFSIEALKHGTIACVSDPHEIANVLGEQGVDYMIESGENSNMYFFFGAPSCVPATPLESSGSILDAHAIKDLLKRKEIKFLAEMMNFVGVINNDSEVHGKLNAAKELNLPIDGHAPGLNSNQLKKYANAGITTDHESSNINEAIDKIKHGIKIQIREGSAAKNFDALIDLIDQYPNEIMFCSDDLHPDDLIKGHINLLVKRAIEKGKDIYDVLRATSLIPIKHYNLDVGLIQKGDSADFIVVDTLKEFNVEEVWIKGKKIYDNQDTNLTKEKAKIVNRFNGKPIHVEQLLLPYNGEKNIRVIEAINGELISNEIHVKPKIQNGNIVSDTKNDILKIVVLNRYENRKPSIGFIKNFGIKSGAIASSIAHDSHNIIAIGTNDEDLCNVINLIIKEKGGIAFLENDKMEVLSLPIAGIMSDKSCKEVGEKYKKLTKLVQEKGSKLTAPFMTLSFMALIVIPKLKINDRGLFDVEKFEFVDLKV